MEGWDPPRKAVAATTAVEARAARSAGPAAPGTMGVSLGAAGDFIRRQLALQAEKRGNKPPDGDGDPPPRPTLTVVGEGVAVRGD